jgi:TRAP transporter TAXI family solute receptor
MGMSITFNNPSDMSSMLIDGHADVAISTSRVPASYLLDLDSSIEGLRWLDLDKNVIERLSDEYGYMPGVQPKGSYTSVKKDTPTVVIDHIVLVHEGMDEELVYQIVKTIMSDAEKVHSIPALKTFSAKVAGTGTAIPLHKGAIRAYKELGLPCDE